MNEMEVVIKSHVAKSWQESFCSENGSGSGIPANLSAQTKTSVNDFNDFARTGTHDIVPFSGRHSVGGGGKYTGDVASKAGVAWKGEENNQSFESQISSNETCVLFPI